MSLLPLVLSAKRSSWRMDDRDHDAADRSFHEIRPRVLERDRFRCRFCGFEARKWQEVHHLDDNHANNAPANLVTACGFCHMCHHVGRAGLLGEAVLIWLPEIGQAALHHILRAVFVGMSPVHAAGGQPGAPGQIHDACRVIFGVLRNRESLAKERIGTSSPLTLGNVLLGMSEADYRRRQELLAGIRLLPIGRKMQDTGNVFPSIVEFWAGSEGPFASLKPATWPKMLEPILKAA